MSRTRSGRERTRRGATAAPAGRTVYVLDAWNDTDQESVVRVFATRPAAARAMARLVARPGDWYAGVVKRTVQ